MSKCFVYLCASVVLPFAASAQARHFPLESAAGLRLDNVVVQPATHQGRRGVRITESATESIAAGQPGPDLIASIDGLEFSNGTIEAEVVGHFRNLTVTPDQTG